MIKKSRLNRHYKEGQPSIKPNDYAYEVPKTYCEFHVAPSVKAIEEEISNVNDNASNIEAIKPDDKKENVATPPPGSGPSGLFWWER